MMVKSQIATVQIAIRESTLQALLTLRQSNDESVAGVIARLAESQNLPREDEKSVEAVLVTQVGEGRHKYETTFLNHILGADALGEM